MNQINLALLGAMLLAAALGTADAEEPPVAPCPNQPCADSARDHEAEPPDGDEIIEIWGTAPRPGFGVVLRERELAQGKAVNLGEALLGIPGVSAVRRSASGVDPVIRGLSGERVGTWFGPVPIHGACPSRMDPPVTILSAHAAAAVEISRGAGTVTQGAEGTAGRIVIAPDFERAAGSGNQLAGFAGGGYESARAGYRSFAGVQGGTERFDFRTVAEWLQYHDYRSGGGQLVPSGLSKGGASLSLGARPTNDQRVWSAIVFSHESGVDFPALPMDIDRSDAWLANLGYRITRRRGLLRRIEVTAGLAAVDHLMSNRDRTNWATMEAETPSDSLSFGSRATLTLRASSHTSLTTGVDGFLLRKDATRTRRMVATGQTFYDHLWPDATQGDAGLYAEFQHAVTDRLRLRAGARADLLISRAGAAGDPSLGGLSVREQYAAYYGEGATDTNRVQPTAAAVVAVKWLAASWLTATVDTGLSMRGAGVTERYFAFGPAPGGYQVGNPTLDAEKKWDLSVGFDSRQPWLDLSLAGFSSWVADYILPVEIDRRDVNGDGAEDRIRGFRNVTALLYGFEAALALHHPCHPLSLVLDLAYVHGQNRSQDQPLPELPPLEGRAAVRYGGGQRYRWWIEAGPRFAARQRRVDPRFPEDQTPGFVTASARAGIDVTRSIHLEVGVDNLLDADYHEHLSREAVMAVGDLAAGDEVPAPGRSLFVTMVGRI